MEELLHLISRTEIKNVAPVSMSFTDMQFEQRGPDDPNQAAAAAAVLLLLSPAERLEPAP